MDFRLRSTAFDDGATMPTRYAREGENMTPPLEWDNAPPETRSFALVVEDPDAPGGTFRHFGLFDIGPDCNRLPEGLDPLGTGSMRMAVNDFGNERWDGPEPPPGHGPHRYRFRLAALKVARLELPDHASAGDLWREAMRHAIGEAETVATYERT